MMDTTRVLVDRRSVLRRTIQLMAIGAVIGATSLAAAGCGSSSGRSNQGGGGGGAIFAPIESPHQTAYFNLAVLPPGFTAALGWMQAIDIRGQGAPSTVEIDWMRLHAIVNGVDTIIMVEEFSIRTSAMDYFGLYGRSPWFAGDRLGAMPFTVNNGAMTMEPGTISDRVFHWWTPRVTIPAGATRVWFEARIRVTGGAGVQCGIDFWRDVNAPYAGPNVNNVESGASDWFGDSTSDWQNIAVGRP
jgi:hypothetical protein